MCTFAARHAVGKRPLHYNTRKISLNLVCSLLFSHEAFQNVEKTTAIH